jgi:hypothetical protein
MDPRDISDRSRGVALALAAAIGPFGAHRFYVGKIGTGLAMLCTLGGLGIWWIYDVITIAAGAFRDMDGKRVWQWAEPGSLEGRDGRTLTPEHYDVLLSEIDGLRADMGELAERVDFMERMVARSRSMEELPPP